VAVPLRRQQGVQARVVFGPVVDVGVAGVPGLLKPVDQRAVDRPLTADPRKVQQIRPRQRPRRRRRNRQNRVVGATAGQQQRQADQQNAKGETGPSGCKNDTGFHVGHHNRTN